jgi:hypothetical protein
MIMVMLNAVVVFFVVIIDDTVPPPHCAEISHNVNLFMCDEVTE